MSESNASFSISSSDLPRYIVDRYPYLLIDRVDNVIPGKSAIGFKNLTWNEWFFPVHYQDDPCMPGFLIAESITEMCTIPVLTLPENAGKSVYLVGSKNFRLFGKVIPGDKLDIFTEIISIRHGIINGKGAAKVNDKLIGSIEMTFVLTDYEIGMH